MRPENQDDVRPPERMRTYYGDEDEPLVHPDAEPFDIEPSPVKLSGWALLFNPYHDGGTGRFTTGPGVGGGFRKGERRFERPEHSADDPYISREIPIAGGVTVKVYNGTEVTDEELDTVIGMVDKITTKYPDMDPFTVTLHDRKSQGMAVVETGFSGWYDTRGATWAGEPVGQVNISMHNSRREAAANWLMPSSSGHMLEYVTAHEIGHHHDMSRRGPKNGYRQEALVQGLFSELAFADVPGRYALQNDMEAYAESFAEWTMTGGSTSNKTIRTYAKVFNW